MTGKSGYFTGRYAAQIIGYKPRWKWCQKWCLTRWIGKVRTKPIWEFRNDDKNPLTWHVPNGVDVQPDRHFFFDFGSVPRIAQLVWSAYCFARSFIFHDSGYEYKGLWMRRPSAVDATLAGDLDFEWLPYVPPSKTFTFYTMSQKQADLVLYHCVDAEGGHWMDRNIIHGAVEAFGKSTWDDETPETLPPSVR